MDVTKSIKEWHQAIKSSGTPFCGRCGQWNSFYDDCGFFYATLPSGYKPICEECFNTLGLRTAER